MKRNEILINRDDVNAKREKIINLFNETMTNEINEKKKKLINFEIVTTAKEEEMMMKKKVSIKSDNSQMFKILDVKNLIKRVSTKLVINDTTTFLNIFKNSLFDFEKFLK